MKILFSIVCLSLALVTGSSALAEEPLHKTDPVLFLTLQNYRVLSGRIHKILEYRLASLQDCPIATQTSLKTRFDKLPKFSDKKESVLETLSLYQDSYNTPPICKKSLDKNESNFKDFERNKFSFLHKLLDAYCSTSVADTTGSVDRKCFLKYHQALSDLDPHCVSFQVPNFTNDVDSFPCMMADYLIGKSMVSGTTWKNYVQNTQIYLNEFRKALEDPAQHVRGIDLWSVYLGNRQDTPELREEFLAQLNFFFSSSQSSSSYIRGFHDHIWQLVLKNTQSPEITLDYFVASRINVDVFRTLFFSAIQNKIPMNIRGIKTTEKNRHNFMAAYLACHYRKENLLFHESLPVVLGYAYETLDFKSHIVDEKLSFEASKENFLTDTNRYRTGVYWGYRFCTQQL